MNKNRDGDDEDQDDDDDSGGDIRGRLSTFSSRVSFVGNLQSLSEKNVTAICFHVMWFFIFSRFK